MFLSRGNRDLGVAFQILPRSQASSRGEAKAQGCQCPFCCTFIHRVVFKEVSGHRVLLKSVLGNRGLSACGTPHEATSRNFPQAPRRAVCGTRGSLRTMHGGAVPLRVVPSPTGLPSKRCPCNGFFSRVYWEIGVFRHVAPPTRPRLEISQEIGRAHV